MASTPRFGIGNLIQQRVQSRFLISFDSRAIVGQIVFRTILLLAAHGTVVYLYTSVAEQLKRTSKSRNRPLLNEGDPAETLERLMSTRDPQYREIADIIIETDGRQVAAVARELMSALESGRGN